MEIQFHGRDPRLRIGYSKQCITNPLISPIMNSRQEDKFSMYYVLRDTCENHQASWITNAVFKASYNLWAEKIPLIEKSRDEQIHETTGITTDKNVKREAMLTSALFIEKRLQSYATVTNNYELLESIKYTATDLKKARGNDAIAMCNIVSAEATTHAAALVSYGVTSEMIEELNDLITEYSVALPKPKVAKSKTKTATQNIDRYFKEADEILTTRLDLDIEQFKFTDPEFYSQYQTARIIIATGGSPVSVLGCITNATTSEPLKGVTVTFVAIDSEAVKAARTEPVKPIVKKSADKGKFRVPLPESNYRVTVEKIGFKKQDLTITVAKGESTDLNISLEKE